MESSGTQKKRLITDINMVPFIDVVLVLLVIFMILSPLLSQSEIPVNLPKAVSKRAMEDTDPIKVRITKQGDFYLGSDRVLRGNVAKQLAGLVSKDPQKSVLIEADRDVSFKTVVVGLDAAYQANASKVGVAVLTESE